MDFQRSTLAYCTLLFLFISVRPALCQGDQPYVSFKNGKGYFPLSISGKSNSLYASQNDYPGVLRALKDVQTDIGRVTNVPPQLITDKTPSGANVIIAGTIGKSSLIDELIKNKKLDVSNVQGKWETFVLQTIDKPFPGVDHALVIVGSDKRGTIFGLYDLAQQIGVSPWFWWADVPVKKQTEIYVLPGRHSKGEPKVKYRGIFINDEQPALGGWVRENYGGFNHQFYEKVFQLILRMKGNFLWPAMWGQSMFSDDPLSATLADEYGVVISTSHHEPMMRAHVEWARAKAGAWNYKTNDSTLREFWREGIKRMGNRESIVTLAMRGDGDEPMSEDSNVKLLQRIVADQRKILSEVTGKDITTIPQVWALYKEVQDYYDKGMRVPDDVTLLLCDDNWGNIRKLPKPGEAPRAGGYGIYYHYDYVGGPRNYKWLNTNPLPRIWEQMNLAYEYGANRIWIVNVGDIKPMEFPIQFFLDFSWNPEKIKKDELNAYTAKWAEEQFGKTYATEIARILSAYAKFNSRRKPELLAADTYSLTSYHEAERVVDEYNNLAVEAERIYNLLPTEYKDAYYQLVLYPVKACANLNELKVTNGKNYLYAKQGRASTNDLAKNVEELFTRDGEFSKYYNKTMAGGKWNHMMDQTHISYTYWQQPDKDVMPEVKKIELTDTSDMGVAVEGSENWWPSEKSQAVLPVFDNNNKQVSYVDVFNRGKIPFAYTVKSTKPWIKVAPEKGTVTKEQRILVSVDWEKAEKGRSRVPITIAGPAGKEVVVFAEVNNAENKNSIGKNEFIESNGFVSMEAIHYKNAVNTGNVKWEEIPGLGRTLSGMATFPVTAKVTSPGAETPTLEYVVHFADTGKVNVMTYCAPTIDFLNNGGLKYAISIDNEAPQIINIHPDNSTRAWEKSVADNIIISTSAHHLKTPGKHTIKFWRVDPGVVLEKIVIDRGGLKPSYLGPPESFYGK
jgi:hypothetical protein